MKKFTIMFGLIFCFSAQAQWIQVVKNSDKDAFFYDPSTLGIYENYRKVWTLVNYGQAMPKGTEKIMSKSSYYKFDCQASRYAVVAEISTSEPGGAGKIVDRVQASEDKWIDLSSNENLLAVSKAACSR